MIRFLVTLLVLMSGLAAQGVPADARVFGARAEIGAVESVQGTARVAAVAASGGVASVASARPSAPLALITPTSFFLPAISVRTGIDRARE